MIIDLILHLLQGFFLLAISPLIIGFIRKLKARFQSRQGARIIQPYYDLIKLFHKGSVVSKTTSWIFLITPYVCMIAAIIGSFYLPIIFANTKAVFGGIILLVYFLATHRLFMVLAGLDAATAFGGMGSSREMMISAIVEPILFLSILIVAILTRSMHLDTMSINLIAGGVNTLSPALIMGFTALFIMMLAENARIPFDNPTTHLELTMVHEAMILEYSGKPLALMEWSSWTKLTIYLSILANMFFPWGMATSYSFGAILLAILIFIIKMAILVVAIAFIESSISKLRLFKLPTLFGLGFFFAFIGVILALLE